MLLRVTLKPPELAVVVAELLPDLVRAKVPVEVVVALRIERDAGVRVPFGVGLRLIVESRVVLSTARFPKRSTKLTAAVTLPALPRAGATVQV